MTLPEKQLRALRALRFGPLTAPEYARDLDTTRNTAEYGLKALCARGLAQRKLANPDSVRDGYVYSITAEGRAWVSGPEPVKTAQPSERCPWFNLGADSRPNYNEKSRNQHTR